MQPGETLFRPFKPGDETAFRELNEAWITSLFTLESKDIEVLGDPTLHILNPGGKILIAEVDNHPIGCCALLAIDAQTFELAKMAVAESHRGAGIGRRLLTYAIDYATGIGAKRLYLESSPKLPNAVHLYESVGFKHLPPERIQPSPYARSGVYMEMDL